ncbi:MAG: VWA domain-containing protein, partial [Terracidiphilus sp.]
VMAAQSMTAANAVPRAKAAQASNNAPPASSTLLQANANLVLVDVVATGHGSPVLGIDRDRFRVFEDGKERPVTVFDEHRPSPTPASAASIEAQIATLPAHTFTNLPIYPDTGAVNVLLLDALNTPVKDQAEARVQMIQYMAAIKPGTELAIFTLASHLQLVEGFTTDAARLAAVLKGKKAASSQSVVLEPQNDSVQSSLEDEAADMEEGSSAPPIFAIQSIEQFESDLTTFQTDLRVRMTLDALDELARYLSAIPGRKNVIWFSGSFPITLDPDQDQTSLRNVETYADQIRQTSDLLTAARVAVYPVDARGLMNLASVDANYQPSRNSMSVSNRGKVTSRTLGGNISSDDTKFLSQNAEEHESMQAIAEETGGKAFYNTNDLKTAVAEAIDNGDSYYTLGFVPKGKLDGHYRRIKVDVDGGHYKLSYRKGYYAGPANKPSSHNPGVASPIETATLRGAPDSTQVLFAARVLPSTDPAFAGMKIPKTAVGEMAASLKAPLHLYLVDFTVDPNTIAFSQTPGGVRQAQIEFILMAYDASGNRVNYEGHGFDLNLSPRRYASTLHYGLRARLALDLPPGSDSLRIAVLDQSNEHTGSLEVPLSVPR